LKESELAVSEKEIGEILKHMNQKVQKTKESLGDEKFEAI
jgi:hypothetical protein